MPLVLQSRLLRVLAEGEVLPLGAEQPIPVRLHIVCATHQDLPRLVAEGRFREDLYYRLNGAVFLLPPLREREDIGTVIDRVLHEEAQAMSRELRLADRNPRRPAAPPVAGQHPPAAPRDALRLRDQRRAAADAPVVPAGSLQRRAVDLMRAAAQPALPPLVAETEARRLPSSPRIWRCANACSKPCAVTSGR
jgi:hypothetical protein